MARNSFYGGSVIEEELAASIDVNSSVASAAATAAAASAASAATANSEVDTKVALIESYVTGVYLGAKSSEPSVDNAGNALTAGTWFFNTTTDLSMIYNGSTFQPVLASVDGLMPLGGGEFTGAVTTTSTIDGRDIATDGTKLDTIETSATADQTGAEIKTAYEGESDTNAYTDAEKTKLAGITPGATTNMTGAAIKTAYEAEADTNAYNDAAVTKLAGIEALADVTDAVNVAAAGAAMKNGTTFTGDVAVNAKLTVQEITETVGSHSTSFTPDLTSGTVFVLTAAGTVTMPTAVAGKSWTLVVNTGTHVGWNGTILWNAGAEPVKSAGIDTYVFVCADGSNWLGAQSGTLYA